MLRFLLELLLLISNALNTSRQPHKNEPTKERKLAALDRRNKYSNKMHGTPFADLCNEDESANKTI